MRAIVLCLLLGAATAAYADVKLGIKTVKGVVSFVVGDEWPVLSMKTKEPVPTAVFQIPNPADADTPDSTNLVLSLCYLDTEKGRAAFEKPIQQYGLTPPLQERRDEWTVYRQRAMQGATEYTILDAKRRSVADVAVTVRLAWPHLKNNPASYNQDMENTFASFLASVVGETGARPQKEGEVWRRPTE